MARPVQAVTSRQLVSTTRPAAVEDPIALFAAQGARSTRALWLQPATSQALVGLGSALTLTGGGPARFRQVASAWRALLADAAIESCEGRGPLLLGGFSFDPLRPATRLWRGFGEARMVLAERLLRIERGSAWLTTNTAAGPESDARVLHEPAYGLPAAAWEALVGTVAHGIRDGQLGVRKVVLARAHEVRGQASVETALRRLASDYPSCTIFAFAVGDACFMGATPERLVALHQGTATTVALAGSAPRGATPEIDSASAARLLGDPKERTEHDVVVGALRKALADLSTRVIADAEPRLRTLPNVHHLVTPMRAQLQPGRSLLDVVERLHPTPATGGFPSARALELIREYESLDRGWYAAPIGWLDAGGDGEFVVGLRSALLRKDTATLFAGCGIVGDSDPATELAEWGWKLQPMLGALGLKEP